MSFCHIYSINLLFLLTFELFLFQGGYNTALTTRHLIFHLQKIKNKIFNVTGNLNFRLSVGHFLSYFYKIVTGF